MDNFAPVILLVENVSRAFLLHRNFHSHLFPVEHRREAETWAATSVYPLVGECPQVHSTDLAADTKKRVGGDVKICVTDYTFEEYLIEDTWKANRSSGLSKLAIQDV